MSEQQCCKPDLRFQWCRNTAYLAPKTCPMFSFKPNPAAEQRRKVFAASPTWHQHCHRRCCHDLGDGLIHLVKQEESFLSHEACGHHCLENHIVSFWPGVNHYAASKTLAERAAWDFIKTDGGGLELAVVNPVSQARMQRLLCSVP